MTRWVHIWLGYITIIWGNWSVLTGLWSYDSSIKGLIFLHFASYIVAFAICETIHCFIKKHKKYGSKEGFSKIKKTMTIEEFNEHIKNGKKYCLYNNYVLNVALYRFEHPGGRHLFDPCIG